MNNLIKLTHTGNGDSIPVDEQRVCLISNFGGDWQTLCGEMYSHSGGGDGCYEVEKTQKARGGITCKKCLEIITLSKSYKS